MASHEVNDGRATTFNTTAMAGQTRDCIDPWSQPMVQVAGDVWPCCWFYASLGNVHKEPFDQVVNNEAFQELRRELLTGNLRKQCVECPSRSLTTPDKLLKRLREHQAG